MVLQLTAEEWLTGKSVLIIGRFRCLRLTLSNYVVQKFPSKQIIAIFFKLQCFITNSDKLAFNDLLVEIILAYLNICVPY